MVPFFKHSGRTWSLRAVGTIRICGRWRSFRLSLFVVLVLVGSSNAVNLTDGLDGLAIGCTVIAAGALTVLTYVSGHACFPTILNCRRCRRWRS